MARRRLAVSTLIGALLVLVLAACAGAPPSPTAAPAQKAAPAPTAEQKAAAVPTAQPKPAPTVDEKKTAITVVYGSEPRSLNPPIDMVKTTVNIELQMFEPLVATDEKLKVSSGGMAEKWERTGDLTWRFYLRNGVKFHNGEDMDADAVAFSVKAYKEASGQVTPTFGVIKETKVIDKSTIELTTTAPNAAIPEVMSLLYILPKGYYAQVGPEQFALKPVGTGPFEFVEWAKGSQIVVKRNANYWGVKPTISQITFRWAPEASTRVAMLESGQVDLIEAVPPQMISRIKASGHKVEQIQGLRKMFVEYNIFQPPFTDIRLRKAVAYAMNVDELVQTVVSGTGVRTTSIMPSYYPSYDPSVAPVYNYDPAKAKQLMAEAGVPNGFSFNFFHPVGRYVFDKEVAAAIAGQLSKVGINVTLKGMETGAYFSDLSATKFDGMHLLTYAPLYPHEDRVVRGQWYSKGSYKYGNSPEGDKMIEEASTISDPAKRKVAYNALEKYLMTDLVSLIPMYDFVDTYGVSKRLQWKPRPDEIMDFRKATVE